MARSSHSSGDGPARPARVMVLLGSSSDLPVIEKMRPLLGDAGWGQPLRDESAYKGEKYADVFFEDVTAFFAHRGLSG